MARSPDPGTAAKDPVDDAAWMTITAAHAKEGPPDWLFPEDHPPDPEDLDAWPGDFRRPPRRPRLRARRTRAGCTGHQAGRLARTP
jgi:hypothetical protein